jgi:hypothetical protein
LDAISSEVARGVDGARASEFLLGVIERLQTP